MLYSLRTYTADTKKQLESKKKTHSSSLSFYHNGLYHAFCFSVGPKTLLFPCREFFCNQMAANFRKIPKVTVFYITICKSTAGNIARMRREVHRLEDALGYRRSRISCVAYGVYGAANESVWRVDASPRWRHALPMFSYYLGELRNYHRERGHFTGRRLIHKVLEKNHPSRVFGSNVKANWAGLRGQEGAHFFESGLSHLRKKELRVL